MLNVVLFGIPRHLSLSASMRPLYTQTLPQFLPVGPAQQITQHSVQAANKGGWADWLAFVNVRQQSIYDGIMTFTKAHQITFIHSFIHFWHAPL